MKYIVPDEGKDWVLKTIAAAWRAHKCRFKKKHYYAYKDDEARWKNRSKRVPEDDFVKLLATWKKKTEKTRCSRNRDHCLSQKNMHTAGPKSFATIREEMKNAHPNKEPPSLAELFERTRKRSEWKHYKQSYEDTAKKIDEMKNYPCSSDGCDQSDAFLGVMGDNYDGRLRLYGRGVCKKKLKKVNGTSYVVPGEVIESVKASLYQDMRKDMDYDISRIEEVRRLMDEEHLKKKEELEAMKQDLLIEKENMTEQVMQKILEKLPLDVAKKYLL